VSLVKSETNQMTLVLLPGLDGTEILFAPLLRSLPEWIRAVVIRYPDTGANTYEELIEHVDGEVTALGSFAILGWSFGGPLALMIANRHPSQTSGVILCATFVTPPIPILVRLRAIVTTPVFAVVRTFRRIRYVIPGFASSELRRAKAVLWRRVGPRVLAARSRAMMTVDARCWLKTCRVPLMYLASTHDGVVPRSCRDEVIAIAPQTQVYEVNGEHLALFTNPVDSTAGIVRFLCMIKGQPLPVQ